jgi:hypothetical protein
VLTGIAVLRCETSPAPTREILSPVRKLCPRHRANAHPISRSALVCFLQPCFRCRRRGDRASRVLAEINMGKYVFAWLLGVPLGLLTLIYVLAHI